MQFFAQIWTLKLEQFFKNLIKYVFVVHRGVR